MDWQQLLSDKRLGQEHQKGDSGEVRSEFKRDYDRLIFSSPFRRLQNKTQVFPLPGSVFVHNRLTHSLEVASVGMSLGADTAKALLKKDVSLYATNLMDIGTIVSAACLAHDMGNPPFGHSGEKAIQTYFTEGEGQKIKDLVSPDFWEDITHFEGNANAFRLLTHRFKGRRNGGFAMTYATLASIVKYPYSSREIKGNGKFGFFTSESTTYKKIADTLGLIRYSAVGEPLRYARHPLVYLVEAADDICYEIMDIEDSHKLKILSYDETEDLLLGFFDEIGKKRIRERLSEEGITDKQERIVYLRASAIGRLEHCCVDAFIANVDLILRGEFKGSLIEHIPELECEAYRRCVELSFERIYKSKPVLDVELSGYKIMTTLMQVLTEAALYPNRYYSEQLIKRFSSQYDITNENLEIRLQAVLDYISGMTDIFALDIYQKINGIALPIV